MIHHMVVVQGMVIKPDVVYNAYNSLENKKAKVIYMSPQGKVLDQSKVLELAKNEELTILCGQLRKAFD